MTARDPDQVPRRSADPGDDDLIALAEQERSILVSGDRHLLDLAAELPIQSARTFLQRLGSSAPGPSSAPAQRGPEDPSFE